MIPKKDRRETEKNNNSTTVCAQDLFFARRHPEVLGSPQIEVDIAGRVIKSSSPVPNPACHLIYSP